MPIVASAQVGMLFLFKQQWNSPWQNIQLWSISLVQSYKNNLFSKKGYKNRSLRA
jgi:hypothetical protein